MVGQDEIMFKHDRKYNLRSLTECTTMKFEKDIFEKILKDYPDIQFKLLEEADFKQKAS
jgi:CRP-like cAMP-binding protein